MRLQKRCKLNGNITCGKPDRKGMEWDGRENEMGDGMDGGVGLVMECTWHGIGVEAAGVLEKSTPVGEVEWKHN